MRYFPQHAPTLCPPPIIEMGAFILPFGERGSGLQGRPSLASIKAGHVYLEGLWEVDYPMFWARKLGGGRPGQAEGGRHGGVCSVIMSIMTYGLWYVYQAFVCAQGDHLGSPWITPSIRLMRVSIWPIRIAGSWGYYTGSWREAILHVIVILISTALDKIQQ